MPFVAIAAARGQSVTRPLEVHAIAQTGERVAGAGVALLDSTREPIRLGNVDSLGRLVLMAPVGVPLVLQVRHLGYSVAERRVFVAPKAGSDTVVVAIVLRRAVTALDTVRVTAPQSLRARMYHIDSMGIANSTRTLFDAWDVITKLRPDIAEGVPGFCPGVEDVWINGKWIPPELVPPNEIAIERLRTSSPSAATPHLNAQRGPLRSRAMIVSLLSLIKPEDIAEMTFHSCSEPSMAQMHTDAGLFIVLKPGLGFDPGRGVYRAAPPK
jgi:hypothetical protein